MAGLALRAASPAQHREQSKASIKASLPSKEKSLRNRNPPISLGIVRDMQTLLPNKDALNQTC